MTLRVNETDAEGNQRPVPSSQADRQFVSWPVQDEVSSQIFIAIDQGHDLIIDKSRDMGATWLICAAFHWLWLFQPHTMLLEVSRKEDLVDGTSGALFQKHDYLNSWLPEWMRPRIDRARLRLRNLDNNSVIEGESTNQDVARGSRFKAVLVDEAAAIDNLDGVLRATDQATHCRIFNSTARGPSKFAELRASGKITVAILPFWRHPEKGAGAWQVTDANGKVYWTCKAREKDLASKTPREVAENWDMDHGSAGARFFDLSVLNRQKATYAREPDLTGHVVYQPENPVGMLRVSVANRKMEDFHFEPCDPLDKRPHLKLWCDLRHGRPDQDHPYALGIDVSQGVGGSFSAISVFDRQTGWKVGEYLDSTISPDDLAELAAGIGIWFGGPRDKCALICAERNGPGQRFMDTLERLGYPSIYRHTPSGKTSDKASKVLGWHSSRDEKEAKLGQYANALARDDFRNPSSFSLDQCGRYVYLKSGAVGPGELEAIDGAARAVHGDVVVADMLAYEGSLRMQRSRDIPSKPQYGSIQWYADHEQMAQKGENDY
jgi:hypothetical protein